MKIENIKKFFLETWKFLNSVKFTLKDFRLKFINENFKKKSFSKNYKFDRICNLFWKTLQKAVF